MLLSTTVSIPLQTSFSNPKQIVTTSATVNQIMYTVPTGKKFVGQLWSQSNSVLHNITPANGSAFTIQLPTAGTQPLQLTLVAGTIVTNTANAQNQYFVGVETDA